MTESFGTAVVTSGVLLASLAGNWIVNGPSGPLARVIGSGGAAPAEPAQAPPTSPEQGGGQ